MLAFRATLVSVGRLVPFVLVALAVLIGGVVAMRGVDLDRRAELERLRETAAGATPILTALDRYRREHGTLPLEAGALAGLLPEGIVADDIGAVIRFDVGAPPAWLYSVAPGGAGFELSRRLGDAARLVYVEESGHGRWLHSPGEDADPVPVEIP